MADYGAAGPRRDGSPSGRFPQDAYGRPIGRRGSVWSSRARGADDGAGGPSTRARRAARDRAPAWRRLNPWIALAAVVPLLAITGVATVVHLLTSDDPAADARSTAVAATGAPTATASSGHTSSSDARFVKTGECLKSDGEAARPKLTIAPCAPKTYEVLARFDGATDGEADAKLKCGTVPGYTNWYFFKSELDVLDYVLCLKLR